MVGDLHVAVRVGAEQEPCPALHLGHLELARPLEGRVRLGHEDGDRSRDLHLALLAAPHHLATDLEHAVRGGRYRQDVLVGLGGKAHHEVELDAAPPMLEGVSRRALEVFLSHVLVDHVAEALGAGLRGKGETAALGTRGGVCHVHPKGVEALRGDGHADASAGEPLVKLVQHGGALRVVGGRKRREG